MNPLKPLQRLPVIVNPASGRRRGLKVLARLSDALSSGGVMVEPFVTDGPQHARRIAQSLALEGASGLGVIGGDGTVHETIEGLFARSDGARPPLALIPAGSGNTMHQHLRISSPAEAAEAILGGETRGLDIARVSTETGVFHSCDLVGWGLVADVNRRAEKWRWLGPSRYTAASVWEILRSRRRTARIQMDEQVDEGQFLLAIACNTKFGGIDLKMCPAAEIDDGRIDVVIVRPSFVGAVQEGSVKVTRRFCLNSTETAALCRS